MEKLLKSLYILIGFLVVISIYLMIFNRPLYCQIALFGPINNVPVFCLQEAVKNLLQP